MNFRGRKTLLLFCCTLFGLATTATLTLAQSSPGGGVDDSNGAFQLEGNATNDTGICWEPPPTGPSIATPGSGNSCPAGFTFVPFGSQTDDWSNVNAGGSSFHGLATTGIVTDVTNSTSDNIFTGGGSKDINDIPSWLFKSGKPQGKDDIAHAFAAAYTLPNGPHAGHTVLYFGLDRFDNSGDATAGFWFMQDSTIGLGGAAGGGGTHFTGKHMDGDLLVVSDFSTGGAISTITLFKWVASLGTIQKVTSIPGAQVGECNLTTGSNDLCAIVNPVPVPTGGWGFLNKRGATVFDSGEFLEGGLDLTVVFGSSIPCFTVFMAETRSSTTPDATLSDFSPPVSLPLCSISVTKSCNGNGMVSSDGTSVAYSWTVTVNNTGFGNLFDPTVTDTLPNGTLETISLHPSCGSTPDCLAGHLSTSTQVTFTATSANVSNPLSVVNTADAFAFTEPNSGGVKIVPKPDVPQTSMCIASAPGMLSVTKHCDATHGGPILVSQGGNVVVEVPFTAVVCNTEPAGTGEAVNNITLSDIPSATITPSSISSLAPGVCTPASGPGSISGSYFPSSISSGDGTTAGRFFFTDTLTATGKGAIKGDTITNSGAVSCPICPDSECTGVPLP